MRAAQLLRSSAVRVALLHALLFGAAVLVLFTFIYWSTAGFMRQQADAATAAEIEGLAERYRVEGVRGLTALIEQRLSRAPVGPSIYLFATPERQRIAGNIDRWPSDQFDSSGWVDFRLGDPTIGSTREGGFARAKVLRLAGGYLLLVGRDMQEIEAIENRIARTLAWGIAITAMLALLSGVGLAQEMGRRLVKINVAIDEIMAGELSRRLPSHESGDELDMLVEKVNGMLDSLESSMDDVRRVSDNIAHDLRTPLTRLRNRLESLRKVEEAESNQAIDNAIHDADHLLHTFNALLRIARVESRRAREGFAPVELAPLVADVAELYAPLADERQQSLEVVTNSQPAIIADRDLIFQALANLLDNAVKYTPTSGHLRLALDTDDDFALLTVQDNGPGIAAESRERSLRRFWRADSSRSTPGSGLGLSLVEAVARLHGASLRLEDADPGLRVVLKLPLA